MRTAGLCFALVSVCCLSAGCGALRGIEQWKCDTLGLCHFGVSPTPECSACQPPVLVPPPDTAMEFEMEMPAVEVMPSLEPVPTPDMLPDMETLPPVSPDYSL